MERSRLPKSVRIVEVAPRDGLQNETLRVPTAVKVELIERLGDAGLQTIEAGAFVSPKWAPQMADTADVLRVIDKKPGCAYPVLTPNLQGFEAAIAAGAREVAIFAAASESFSQKNIRCSIAESLDRFAAVTAAARTAGVKVRGYVSCVAGCPYEGDVPEKAAADVTAALADMGCYEISLGDTIGVGTPAKIKRVIEAVGTRVPVEKLAGHFHDTYGMAIANVYAALEMGVSVLDASVGGLGGCPYAKGASGNVATEDLLWLLRGENIETGVDLAAVVNTARWVCRVLGREPNSRGARTLFNA